MIQSSFIEVHNILCKKPIDKSPIENKCQKAKAKPNNIVTDMSESLSHQQFDVLDIALLGSWFGIWLAFDGPVHIPASDGED